MSIAYESVHKESRTMQPNSDVHVVQKQVRLPISKNHLHPQGMAVAG